MSTEIDHSIRDHARRAPSDSKRWTECTSSIDYERMFALASLDILPQAQSIEMNKLLTRFNTTYGDARSVGYSDQDETEFNKEGTEAHEWAEKVLRGQCSIKDVPEHYTLASGKVNEMRAPVATYIYECRKIADEDEDEGMKPFIEAKVPLFYNKSETGTMDYAVVSQTRVRVRDYKHGVGIFVEVEDNTQMAIYTLSFMQMLEDDGLYTFDPDTEIEIGIVQPRHRQWDSGNYWTLSYHDLQQFCKRKIQKAHDIIDEGIETVFAPGPDTCQWCKLKAFCGARLHHMSKGLPIREGYDLSDLLDDMPTYEERGSQGKFETAMPDELDRLNHYAENFGVVTEALLVKAIQHEKSLVAWLKDARKYLTRQALTGRAAEGTKLVLGREGNSEWSNPAAADDLLDSVGVPEEDRHVVKIISPSKAKEALADRLKPKIGRQPNPDFDKDLAERIDGLIVRSPGKKVLALEGDKRPAVESNIDDFTDLDELLETDEME